MQLTILESPLVFLSPMMTDFPASVQVTLRLFLFILTFFLLSSTHEMMHEYATDLKHAHDLVSNAHFRGAKDELAVAGRPLKKNCKKTSAYESQK